MTNNKRFHENRFLSGLKPSGWLPIAAFLGLFATSFAVPAAAAEIDVYKTPWCGCCSGWVDEMVANGHSVTVNDMETLDSIKLMAGVPPELEACHTALVDGFVIEGHVPAADVARLLTERPEAKGLAVPGMPMGAPGMGGEAEPYDVVLFTADGATSIYASY